MNELIKDIRHACQRWNELEEENNAYLETALKRQKERDEARSVARVAFKTKGALSARCLERHPWLLEADEEAR